jgi:hypothetical protein
MKRRSLYPSPNEKQARAVIQEQTPAAYISIRSPRQIASTLGDTTASDKRGFQLSK